MNVPTNSRGYHHSEDSSSTISDDEVSVWSIDASLDCSEYRNCCEMLEEQLKYNIVAKQFQERHHGRYCFLSEELPIQVGVRSDGKKTWVEFSCNVHTLATNENHHMPSPYAMMTTMMKYKTMLNQNNKQEQLGRCGDSFIFLRSVTTSMLNKEHFVAFGNDIDDFIMKAHAMHEGFARKCAMIRSMKSAREQRSSRKPKT
jgi:hypothetical protein